MQIRALTREELAEWWKLYVAAVDKQLSAADAAGSDAAAPPDAAVQLATLQREALSLLTRCRPAFPALCQGWFPCIAVHPHGRAAARGGPTDHYLVLEQTAQVMG